MKYLKTFESKKSDRESEDFYEKFKKDMIFKDFKNGDHVVLDENWIPAHVDFSLPGNSEIFKEQLKDVYYKKIIQV